MQVFPSVSRVTWMVGCGRVLEYTSSQHKVCKDVGITCCYDAITKTDSWCLMRCSLIDDLTCFCNWHKETLLTRSVSPPRDKKRVSKKKLSWIQHASCWHHYRSAAASTWIGEVFGVGRVYHCKIARIVPYNQLAFWALLEAIVGDPLPLATFAKERYCNFTLSALSKVFTTYLLCKWANYGKETDFQTTQHKDCSWFR